MKRMADVTILGGGVIGLSIALELADTGARVRLLDRGGFGREASWAGAGMLPPGRLETATTPDARLRGLSHALWPELAARLLRDTGIDGGFHLCGAVRLFESAAERDADVAHWQAEKVVAEPLAAADLRRLEPHLSRQFCHAVHLPEQGQIRNPRHLRALVAACAGQGVELVPDAVHVTWDAIGTRIRGVQTARGHFESARYCVAAGAWSAGLLAPLGVTLPVRPVRGQIVLLDVLPSPLRRTIELGSRYLVPRPDGKLLVGSTEEEVGFEKCNTPSGTASLLDLAARLCPALATAHVERFWAGLRPGSPRGIPYLGHVPGFDNLFVAAGHFRNGLQMSPGTARLMRQVVLDQPTAFPLDEFQISSTM